MITSTSNIHSSMAYINQLKTHIVDPEIKKEFNELKSEIFYTGIEGEELRARIIDILSETKGNENWEALHAIETPETLNKVTKTAKLFYSNPSSRNIRNLCRQGRVEETFL